ncbi:MAG: transcription elongation factor GreA [Acidobacteria bacterium]|nr:transcription elongation factor GreA [Acidobacteriota bacterium]MCY4634667.1 transcription elongation factor GreA [Acidobacteriota bacterium]
MKARLLKRIEGEIQTLERELTRELPREIQRARELGDLRENAEYQAAKERQRLVEARIGMLRTRVAEIALVNFDRLPHDRAALGSTVLLRAADGATVTYELVMPEDADPAKGWVSTASPIGRAIVGREEGDEIHVKTPSGVREFEIIELTTIHQS